MTPARAALFSRPDWWLMLTRLMPDVIGWRSRVKDYRYFPTSCDLDISVWRMPAADSFRPAQMYFIKCYLLYFSVFDVLLSWWWFMLTVIYGFMPALRHIVFYYVLYFMSYCIVFHVLIAFHVMSIYFLDFSLHFWNLHSWNLSFDNMIFLTGWLLWIRKWVFISFVFVM